jgi:hypothetical protein
MSWVRIKFGFEPSSDNEEVLSEYFVIGAITRTPPFIHSVVSRN